MSTLAENVSFLQSSHVLKLTTAARMAGLKFKNGAPGYDKAGIIEKLQMTPSVLAATVATLRRMESGGFSPVPALKPTGPNPFADALDDEGEKASPSPEPIKAITPPDETLSRVLTAVAGLATRVNQVESFKANTAAIPPMIESAVDPLKDITRGLLSAVETLKAEIKTLKEKAPVQMIIGDVSLPVVSGQHVMFPQMLFWLAQKRHILLVGPASSGKTTAAIEFAKLKNLELYSQPLTMDSFGVLGFVGPMGRVETEFSRAWSNGGVFLWDELSMSSPEAIGALNAALANGFASFPGIGVVKAHPDFYMIAGDNSDTGASLKYGARSLLDGASLDRFITLDWNIDPDIESSLASGFESWLACVRAIRAEIERRDIAHVGATMRAVIAGVGALQQPAHRDGLITRRMILEATCRKGALRAEWDAILRLPAVSSFLQGA